MGFFSSVFKGISSVVKSVVSIPINIVKASLGIFEQPKLPKPYVPPAPKIDSPEVQAKLLEAKKKVASMYAGLGRSSTILTGGKGVQGAAPVWRKTLLGE